jgi:hypothetical protein
MERGSELPAASVAEYPGGIPRITMLEAPGEVSRDSDRPATPPLHPTGGPSQHQSDIDSLELTFDDNLSVEQPTRDRRLARIDT